MNVIEREEDEEDNEEERKKKKKKKRLRNGTDSIPRNGFSF